MLVIGKANKFYTLWQVNTEKYRDAFGPYIKTVNNYIKNISFSLEEAKRQYPGVEVNESLRGHTSWSTITREKPVEGKFLRGKYIGKDISSCDDYNYLHWYWKNVAIDMEKSIIEETLAPLGYKVLREEGEYGYSSLMTPEELIQLEEVFEKADAMDEYLKNHNTITFSTECNLDEYGYLRLDDVTTVIFPEGSYKVAEYNGFHYGLPTKNNVGKRIKNKSLTIEVQSYEYKKTAMNAWIEVVVKDFVINK